MIFNSTQCFIAGPAFTLLYLVEDYSQISFIVKVIGNQWFWSYEFSDYTFEKFENSLVVFDSIMLTEEDLSIQTFGFRLLEVNNRLKIMHLINTCFLVTSTECEKDNYIIRWKGELISKPKTK